MFPSLLVCIVAGIRNGVKAVQWEGLPSKHTDRILRGERRCKVKYFVKNLKVHKYPVPSRCKVVYTDEKLHDTPPAGTEKCDDCFQLPR